MALLGRQQPSDGPKLVKNRKFRPKIAPHRQLFDQCLCKRTVEPNFRHVRSREARSCEQLDLVDVPVNAFTGLYVWVFPGASGDSDCTNS